MSKQELRDALKRAMLERDAVKTSVLRMLVSAVQYYEIQKGGANYEATTEDILTVIQREVKQHRDSIEQFKNASREDLVSKETKELEILTAYLPKQMSEEEVRSLVVEAIKQTGSLTSSDMGKVMGALMPKVKGKADGGMVSKLVREQLGS